MFFQVTNFIFFVTYTALAFWGVIFLIKNSRQTDFRIKQLNKYLVLSMILFVAIDFLVAFRDNPLYLIENPFFLVYYFGWCFLFGWLYYQKKWRLRHLILLILTFSIFSEFLVSNPYLVETPWKFALFITTPFLWLEYLTFTILPIVLIKRNQRS